MKVTELNAEQVALAYLHTQITNLPKATGSPAVNSSEVQDAAQCVLIHFAQMNGHSDQDLRSQDVQLALAEIVGEANGIQPTAVAKIDPSSKKKIEQQKN